ncbi:acetyltransferase [Vibrio cholerae]|nr:acetyltransferase [Vibrio cholerae]
MRRQPLRRALASYRQESSKSRLNCSENLVSCFENTRIDLCVSIGYLRGRKC